MSFLPKTGTIQYHTYEFNSATSTRITSRPEYDRAGLTIVACVYTLELITYVEAEEGDTNTDRAIEQVRRVLQSPGRQLTYSQKGFGLLDVNGSTVKDVMWGPKPQLLVFEPVGSDQLWKIHWVVSWAIPECESAQYQNALMAFDFDMRYSINDAGLTTRLASGYLEIPITREPGGSRTVRDNADKYRDKIKLPIPEGFRRREQSFTLSDDRRRLDWSIVDEQLAQEGLPIGCMRATGTHTLRPKTEGAVSSWIGEISAQYEVARGRPRKDAWEAFFALVEDRRRTAEIFAPGILPPGAAAPPPNERSMYTVGLTIEQGLYENSALIRFALTYFLACSLKDIIKASGIWDPVPKTDWQQWSTSVEKVTGVRGHAGMKYVNSGELILDLCGGRESLSSLGESPPPNPREPTDTRIDLGARNWLSYNQMVDLEERTGFSAMLTLPKKKTDKLAEGMARGSFSVNEGDPGPMTDSEPGPFDGGQLGQGTGGRQGLLDLLGGRTGTRRGDARWTFDVINQFQNRYPPLPNPTVPQVTIGDSGGLVPQARTVPTYTLRLRGNAIRIGAPIECPALAKFEDADIIPEPTERARFSSRVLGYNLGFPIVYAEWFLPYRICYREGNRTPT